MKKDSKRIINLKNLITEKTYSIDEAIFLLKKLGTAKFVESVEAHFLLNINPKYADQQLRSSLVLPFGTGKSLKIAVLTEPQNISEAVQLGADIAGFDDLINDINLGKIDFDVLITTPNYMSKLAKLGRILGPKGLMPSPKSGTVTQDLKDAITQFKTGKIEYRADKTGIVHLNFGKVNFSDSQLKENLHSIYLSIEKNKPKGVKGRYFKSINLCTTMSPAITLEITSFKKS
jgi:large subunit ribosomal protein L1